MHYWRDERFRDWESVRDFEKLHAELFRGLVTRRLEPLAEPADPERPVFGPSYRVVPGLEMGNLPTMFVNPQSDGVWEHLSGPFPPNQIKLTLIDLFDWK